MVKTLRAFWCPIALLVLAAALLAGALALPARASAATLTESLNSWRYDNGELIDMPDTDGTSDSDLSLLASAYSTWKKSYGISYLGVTNGSTTTKVAVEDAVRVVIDVSKYQGEIDWEKVAAAGVTAAIIRCSGYNANEVFYEDPYYRANVEGAQAAGLKVGVYIYSQATTASEAKTEAKKVLQLLEDVGLDYDDMDLPVFIDLEDELQLSSTKLAAVAKAFCDAMEAEGYAVGIYSSLGWWNNYLTDSVFSTASWYKWVARYPTTVSLAKLASGVSDADLWQFTSHATVPGISGRVDVSFDYHGSGYYVAKPKKVTLKSVTAASDLSSATVTWSKLSIADGYRIYRKTDDGSYELVKTITSRTTTSWTDSTIEPGHTYTYRVRAYNLRSSGERVFGSYSSTASISTVPETVALNAATVASDYGSVALSWDAVLVADGYRIYRKMDDGSYELVKTITDVSTTSWADDTVELNHTYTYRMRAYLLDSSGSKVFGKYSSALEVATQPAQVSITVATVSSSLTSVALTWESVDGAAGYEVYRATSGGSYELVATIADGSATGCTDEGLTAATTYKYKVRAWDEYAQEADGAEDAADGTTGTVYGPYSAAKSVKTRPSTVSITSAKKTSGGNIQVKWSKVSNAAGYVVYRSVNGGSYKKVKTITSASTVKWTDKSVSAGKVYRYKIRAYQTTSDGSKVYSASYSSVKKCTAKPATTSIKSATSTKARAATVKWKKVSGATGYQVAYRKKGSSTWYYETVSGASTTYIKFTSFRSTKYYVKVRAYKTYNGTKYYGSWSSSVLLTVKQ